MFPNLSRPIRSGHSGSLVFGPSSTPRASRSLAAPFLALALVAALPAPAAFAQTDFSQVEIQTEKVADGVYMLVGAGGNIGVSVGDDGVFLVDDQFAPLSDKIRAAVAALSDQPIRFVLNTHWHFDHTGGNENFGEGGALIVAHDNVRVRMSTEQFIAAFDRKQPPAPDVALPVVTYAEGVSFHINGDTLAASHLPPAHTDGDSVVHWQQANVLHAGDLFFNGGFPFVDLSSGGSLPGLISAIGKLLEMVDGETKIIPGHGPLASKADLQKYHDMLVGVRDALTPHVEAGKSLDDVLAANPLDTLGQTWGKGFMNTETFTKIAYESLNADR